MARALNLENATDQSRLANKLRRHTMTMLVFDLHPDAFLVGGFIRDLVAGSKPPMDADFILKDKLTGVAQQIANKYNGTVVILGKEGLVRISLKNKRTIDLSRYTGLVERDLRERDFTINSLAWSPTTGLLDPCNGLNDIKQGLIRTHANDNLLADPLRMLRAYRLSAQFGWRLERRTRVFIKKNAPLLAKVAAERITLELLKLLGGDFHLSALKMANDDSVLHQIIPIKKDRLNYNIKLISSLSAITLRNYTKNIVLDGFQGAGRFEILRLSQLLMGIDSSKCHLALSSNISKKLKIIDKYYLNFQSLGDDDLDEMFHYFEGAGDASEDLLILTGKSILSAELKRFRRIQSRPLVGGHEIMAAMGVSEGGISVGRALRDVKKKQFLRLLTSKRKALNYLMLNIRKYN